MTAEFPQRYSDFRVNEEIAVHVNPDMPEEGMLPDDAVRNKNAVIMMVIGMLFIVVIGFGNALLIANPRVMGQLFMSLMEWRRNR
jgi:hypothetical protein